MPTMSSQPAARRETSSPSCLSIAQRAHSVVLLQLLLGEHAPSASWAQRATDGDWQQAAGTAAVRAAASHTQAGPLPPAMHSRLLAADHLLEVKQRELPLDLLHGGRTAAGASPASAGG